MFIKTLSLGFLFSFLAFFGSAQHLHKLKKGSWSAKLLLNEKTDLPFRLEISGSKSKPVFTVLNAEERIVLKNTPLESDSFQLDFPHFHSFLRFAIQSNKEIKGYWSNLNKGNNYKIPFSASFGAVKPAKTASLLDLTGRWKTTFSPDSDGEELAIGVFKSNLFNLTGTFLTETGDYRFLEGIASDSTFYLSCFDGSHAFFFSGLLTKGTISGSFYSGKHYQTKWKANRDELFELRNPDSITYLVKKENLNFKLKDLNGQDFIFPNEAYKNKVTVIQIMGTWCPNCLDETKYFKSLYEKYHESGLEIISVAYETPADFNEQVKKINLLKTRLNLDYQFLVGGQANKALSSEQFSMLNEIISYPTAIFVNRNGEVVKIHTGFSGPGTGEVYTTYAKETEVFIRDLLGL